jgi:AcrR family transcriptional regulator
MDSPSPEPGTSSKNPGKSEQTRALILSAAAKLFRDEGYNATTLRKIAAAAQMEAGSLYYHFASKDAILDEILQLGVRHVFDAVESVRKNCRLSGRDFRQTFASMVDTHLTYFLRESDFTSANIRNFSRLPEDMRAPHQPLRQAYTSVWDNFLAEAQKAGDIRIDIKVVPLRQFVLGAMNWTVEWYDANRYPVSMLSERMSKLLLEGMSTAHGMPLKQPPPMELETLEVIAAEGGKASRTRAQVLSAAARIFRDRGYKAATMRDIAQEASMEAGSIYYHFRSKDEILDEVLDIGLRALLRGVSATLSQKNQFPDHRSRIAAAIRTHMEYLFRLSEFTSANVRIYGQLPEKVRSRHQPIRHKYANLWDDCLRKAQEAGELRSDIKVVPLRQAMLGALNWTVEWFNPEMSQRDGYYSLPDLIVMLQSLLLDGLQNDAGSPVSRGNSVSTGKKTRNALRAGSRAG